MATPFTLGGEQRVVSIVASLLVKRNYDVTILCTDSDTKVDYNIYNLDSRVKIKYIPGYGSSIMKRNRSKRFEMYEDNVNNGTYKNNFRKQKYINCDFLTELLLINAFNKGRYDYVISLSTIYNTMLARVSNKIKATTIGWQHSCFDLYFDTEGLRHYNQGLYTKYMFKKLDYYVVLTEYDRKLLKERFDVDAVVINNPKSIISSKTSDLKSKNFLAVGRFVSIKNFEKLIDVFNSFHKKNKEWKLYIVGDGELKENYISKIKGYNLEKYVYICDRTDDIESYYLNSSIYLMSSLLEGWGMVIGEAIEFGLPIISFDIPSASEMIFNNENGFIIKKYDYDDYCDKMLKLSRNKSLIDKFGKNSRKISLLKSNDYIADKWEKLFKNELDF